MVPRAVLIALAVVALAAAVYILAKGPATPASPTTAAASVPTYYVPQASGTYWPAETSGQYACAGTINPNWCAFADAASGQAACTTDSKCLGYVVAGNSNWSAGNLPDSAVMLVSTAPTTEYTPGASATGNTFYLKVPGS